MHERRYTAGIDRLRAPERVERLEVERVIKLCTDGHGFRSLLDIGTAAAYLRRDFRSAPLA